MATIVIMPKQGQSVETCIITRWFRHKGDAVTTGDILFSYETDKASFDLESPADGILLDTFFNDGDEVPVLVNVAIIGKSGESTESIIGHQSGPDDHSPSGNKGKGTTPATESVTAADTFVNETKRTRISPRAKRIAREKGLDLNNIQGTGPQGRIIARDVEKPGVAAPGQITATPSAGKEFSDISLSNVRRIIAKTMHNSLQNSAQLTHHMSADVRSILEARKKIKETLATDPNQQDIKLNDMICWCVIRALSKYPEANSHFFEDHIRMFHKVHLGIAVDTARGLMVPAIKNADEMSLVQLSKELKQTADLCRKGNINPSLIQSSAATFTVSNLGNYGVEMFTPVINLPQAAILGVCTILFRPADTGNNIFGFVPYMGLSLTYDHRAIDGGPATLFLKEIKTQIETFSYS